VRGQVPAGLLGAEQGAGEQPAVQGWWDWQLLSPLPPGDDHFSGAGGDRQPAAHPTGLVVVIDQVVLAVDDLQAVEVQADHLAGAPPGVAQDPVGGMVHRLQVGGADRPGPPGWAEPVQVRIELGDHRIGQRLADLVLVGVAADPVAARGAERIGHRGHQPAGPAVLDDLAELVEHQVAVRGGIQDAVGSPLGADGVDDGGEVAGAEAGWVGPAGGGQRVGGGLAGP
jgi:hypothetical protein